MKLTFLGAAHEVTGSCSLLEACGKRILVDCGLEQGPDIYENCELPLAPGDIDAVFLTHAHIDHSGKIPALVKSGYEGPIFTTLATAKLCSIMLRDSAHIQEFEAEWRNRKAKRAGDAFYEPLYTVADAEKAISLFRPFGYKREFLPFDDSDGIVVQFIDAGHLLGSASISFELTEGDTTRTVLFSGDLGNISRPLIRDPSMPQKADFVVIESTYGDRLHGEQPDYVSQLTDVIQDTLDRGGNVVIPSFAVGRTQELLYLLRIIKEQHLIHGHDGFPVYVDSPLAVEATNIYANSDDMLPYYDKETIELLCRGINPIDFPNLRLSVTSDDSKAINFNPEPKVILSASGMCEAGRIRHHLKHNLWRANSTILFVGYQTEGTIGRKLLDGAPYVKLFGEDVAVHAQIKKIEGISGHADKNMLLNWLQHLEAPPKTVFVNHGHDTVCDSFAQSIEEVCQYEALAPYSGDSFDLQDGRCLAKGRIVKIHKETEGRRRADAVYDRSLAALQRLQSLLANSRGRSNKDLAKLADHINSLCDKWE